MTVGVVTILALSGLTGWLSYQTNQAHKAQQQRNRVVEVAREFAVNLTTIDYTRVEADIQRIMDSSIGHFHEDFQRRSQPFVDIVKKTQSKSRGTVTAAGLESQDGDHAQTLIAVSVMTSTSAAPQQPLTGMADADQRPNGWPGRQSIWRRVRAMTATKRHRTITGMERTVMDTNSLTDNSSSELAALDESHTEENDTVSDMDVTDEAHKDKVGDTTDQAEGGSEESSRRWNRLLLRKIKAPIGVIGRFSWKRIAAYGVLPGLALILALGAGYLKWQDFSLRSSQDAATNTVRVATESTIAMLSYRPDTAEKDLTSARDRMTGKFRDDYTQLVDDVIIPGAKQKRISSVATVPAASSVSATQNHAVVLVFVNQSIIIGEDAPTDTASSVRVALDKVNDRWLISQFEPV